MNNSNLPQENIELKAQEIGLETSELASKNKLECEVGITTPPPPQRTLFFRGF